MQDVVVILGSGPNATEAQSWSRDMFDHLVVLNNAWRVRDDWSHFIHPEDFPDERHPPSQRADQVEVTYQSYVPQNNAFGGVLFAGGTMAFTAAYWALGALQPKVMAFIGCDMVYPTVGHTHFYGTGAADPLREDVSLQSLEAKAARLGLIAAYHGCQCVNLSRLESVLPYERFHVAQLRDISAPVVRPVFAVDAIHRAETALGYDVPSGRYWEIADKIDPAKIAEIDQMWLQAYEEIYSP
ncbi:MAG: hypothetical protein JJ868_00045 [Shimia sp.]|uniref:hypothetical protein n=1 Tax=Shimia sp. TaxID=1954381 RepID=UPI001B24DB77|nr:hypothetical protein [Shimia sp.]MBO6895735.1 hypothetical protein [Shimia sp.]